MSSEKALGIGGYIRHPCISGDKITFIAEDDVWIVHINGGHPRRMTNLASVQAVARRPLFSPDGGKIAFASSSDIWVMSVVDARYRRLTWLGSGKAWPVAWRQPAELIIASTWEDPFGRPHLYRVPVEGGQPELLYEGECDTMVFAADGKGVCLGRHTIDPVVTNRWKGYRGGTHGCLWLDRLGSGEFVRLHVKDPFNDDKPLNVASIMWRDDRLWFAADPDGSSNLWSVDLAGEKLQKHTLHEVFDVRNAHCSEAGVVYTHAGQLWFYDDFALNGEARQVHVDFGAPLSHLPYQLDVEDCIEDVALHPTGHVCSCLCRGQVFEMALWSGPAVPLSPARSNANVSDRSIRCQSMEYLSSGRLVCVTDENAPLASFTIYPPACIPDTDNDSPVKARDWLALFMADLGMAPQQLVLQTPIGEITYMEASPVHDAILIATARNELWLLEFVLEGAERPNPQTDPVAKVDGCLQLEIRQLDSSEHEDGITEPDWSPDGEWIAYCRKDSRHGSSIILQNLASTEKTVVAGPDFWNYSPSFDYKGSFLAFFSARVFSPIEDGIIGDLMFSSYSQLPYLLLLQKDAVNPFQRKALSPSQIQEEDDKDEEDDGAEGEDEDDEEDETVKYEPPTQITIDVVGLPERILQFPVEPGSYEGGQWTKEGKFQYMRGIKKAKPACEDEDSDEDEPQFLYAYNFKTLKEEKLAENVLSFTLTKDGGNMLVSLKADDDTSYYCAVAGEKLPMEAGEDDDEVDLESPGPESGLIKMEGRVSLEVVPAQEWAQIFDEVCHHVRGSFFDESCGGIEWDKTCEKYREILPRLRCRSELTDLCAELLAELGVSHISCDGPDAEETPKGEGHLGVRTQWMDFEGGGAYKVEEILRGDIWDPKLSGPLARAGVGITKDAYIIALNRVKVSREISLEQMVAHWFPCEIFVTYVPAESVQAYTDLVRSLKQSGGVDGFRRLTTQQLRAIQEQSGPGVGKKKAKSKKKQKKKEKGGPKSQEVELEKKLCAMLKAMEIDASNGPIWRTVRVSVAGEDVRNSAGFRDVVEARSKEAHTVSGGRVGYIYVPDTCQLGFAEFYRHFGRECEREALIIDLRCNAGGFATEYFLKHLRNQSIGWNIPRPGRGKPYLCPELCTSGRLVLLVDEDTSSDGECWAAAFQNQGLGKVVGVRTWGGVVCIGGADFELIDGSALTLPSEHCYLTGKTGYSLENFGAQPDIVVEQPPNGAAGEDLQLAEAIKEAMKLLESASPSEPTIPPFPQTRLHRRARDL